ncbi:MAG: MOP flippase family protein [Methylococcaceae bacterium]|nr:MOP flippase family protein [Methylococcaceae bacterium]
MSLKKLAASGVKWSSASFAGRRGLSLLTNIILARILTPADFGLVAMGAVVLGFTELFKDLGTGSAVIQRKEMSEEFLSTIFWINAIFGLFATGCLYAISHATGIFYHEPLVEPVLRVMSASFFISSVGIVQNCLLQREMNFEKIAKIDVITALTASAAAITTAMQGFGVWSLVAQVLVGSIVGLALTWGASHWRPKFKFHWNEVRPVMGYSLNLTAANVVNYFSRNADNLLIGRYLGTQDLGYYDLAYRLMVYPIQGTSALIGNVMFPLYSKLQDNNEQFRNVFFSAVGAIALVSFPVMLGLLAVREPFVLALFGAKWEPVMMLLLVFAPLGAMQSIGTTIGSIYMAKGRTDILFRWGILVGIITAIAFVVGLQWGIMGVATAYASASFVLVIPSFVIAFRLIEARLSTLGKTLWLPFLCSAFMCSVVLATAGFLPAQWPQGVILGLLIAWGGIIYLAVTWLINKTQFLHVFNTMSGRG